MRVLHELHRWWMNKHDVPVTAVTVTSGSSYVVMVFEKAAGGSYTAVVERRGRKHLEWHVDAVMAREGLVKHEGNMVYTWHDVADPEIKLRRGDT